MAPALHARVEESRPDPVHGLGAGLYSLSELSRYLTSRGLPASSSKVLRWIQVGLAVSGHQQGAPTYSFHDLVSLLVVGWLRSQGAKLSAIRAAEGYLRGEQRIERPFALEEIYTDGVNVLYRANPAIAEQLTAANRRGQEVLTRALGETLRGIGYAQGVAVSWDIRPHVRLDPGIQFGAPCLSGTRIPTAQLFALSTAGEDVDSLARLFDVPPGWVREAVDLEEELARAA